MKGGRPHCIPWSDAALTSIRARAEIRHNEFVFPGNKANRPLSKTALMAVLKRMGRTVGTTVNGFRASLREWATRQTRFPGEVAGPALGESVWDTADRPERCAHCHCRAV